MRSVDFLFAADGTSAQRVYQAGAVLFTQDDIGDYFGSIHRGLVKLSVASPSGKAAIISICGPGDVIGTECLGGDHRWLATATAMTATTVRVADVVRVRQMMQQSPALTSPFIRHLLS